MMSESRRNRRKEKRKTSKSEISRKDKVIGILAMAAIFMAAVIAIILMNLGFFKHLFE
ncbi:MULTISPECIES: hypothetical protein [Flavobacteriaceae]|jgi:hypothetical protein|uniref:hypothetical protein n=1 Tax=Flavobacteriaceae TaxID=49546 RepID=UPI00166FB141|nr:MULTISPECIES: hypothetical protein [Flavobacteriaceae]|tara:strand:+ start:44909 stop:45082 length:174 start_codon:yes stop_codon:yes gene_type:complete